MPAIRILPPSMVNRIAAGECVERPASVVKELVENALDAGAGRIEVRIEDGGRELIQVSDDGGGIEPDDLPLAVAQHATSKIRGDDDLFNIHTMGFRGEALASIASVARLSITSRRPGNDVGYCLRVDAGEMTPAAPCAAAPGTTVEVRDLFYCVPARRKFLKTNQTEMGHVSEQFARIALAHPGVALSLRHGARVFHQLAAVGDARQRIADFFGPELAAVLLPVRREGGGVLVEGFVAPPKESRGSGKWEYVFVNGRFVRDRFVSHAIKEAYRSLIDPSRYPVAFLFITINPELVDVNVHPTKIEVRWRDSNYIHGQVLATLREKFQRTNLDHALRTPGAGDADRERVRQAMVDFFARSRSVSPQKPLFEKQTRDDQTRDDSSRADQSRTDQSRARKEVVEANAPSSSVFDQTRFDQSRGRDRAIADHASAAGALSQPEAPAAHPLSSSDPPPASGSAELDPSLRPFAPRGIEAATSSTLADANDADPFAATRAIQIHNMFLVVETADGVMIIDQHALHERILYEEFKERLATRRLESQRMLLPDIVRVPADRLEVLETHAETLARLGIELTAAGPQSIAVQAFPSFLHDRVERGQFVIDLLDLLSERGARPAADTLLHEVLDMMACKAAVKAGDPLTAGEIEALLARRITAERSSHCPHGRPTTLHLTLRDLERQFQRR